MGKQSGLGDNFYIDGYNISGDVSALDNISCPMGVLEATGIDKSAIERLPAHRDGMMEGTCLFNDAAGQSHVSLKSLPRTDVVAMYARGTTLGNPSAAMVAKSIDFPGSRGDDGSYTLKFSAQANSFGLDWGELHTAGVRTDASATAAAGVTAVDGGAAGTTNFGLQAYLQVFSLGSGTATVKLQESSDNGADTYADVTGGAFAAVTGRTAERIQTTRALAVERYLKVVTTGTFTDLVFAVMVARNQSTVNY